MAGRKYKSAVKVSILYIFISFVGADGDTTSISGLVLEDNVLESLV